MAQLTHLLKQDLFLPATGNPSKGYLYFPKSEFGLSYEVRPNPKKKTLTVLLGVAELATDELVWPLTIYNITEEGFTTTEFFSNQAEYDTYVTQKALLESQHALLLEELQILLATQGGIEDHESQEFIDATAAVAAKDAEIAVKLEQLAQLTEVTLQPAVINKYDDVITYFKGDGSLTEEGIEWAKTVYYNGQLIGDLVE